MKFIDILDQLNIEYMPEGNHHCRPGWIQLDCPFCGKYSKSWHLGYSLSGNYLNCWRCGSHGLLYTILEITDIPYHEAKKLLGNIETVSIKKDKPKGNYKIPKGVMDLRRVHIRYLRKRGFDIKELKQLWKIRGIGITGNLAWRVFIPIIYHNKEVSWTTRSVSTNKNITRYISASPEQESMFHKELLYGEDYAKDTIIIHEGPTDVWKMGPGAVATMGTGYSVSQMIKMIAFPNRVVCFDNQREAQIRAKKLCDDLSVFPGNTCNVQLDAKDPASATDKEIEQVRNSFL